MKAFATILLALTISTAFAGDKVETVKTDLNEKYYEINKWGYAQFTYWAVTDKKSNKFGAKPISDRTLYNETSRAGIIDSEITWKEFNAMSTDDWKALLVAGQPQVIAAINTGIIPVQTDNLLTQVIKAL